MGTVYVSMRIDITVDNIIRALTVLPPLIRYICCRRLSTSRKLASCVKLMQVKGYGHSLNIIPRLRYPFRLA